MVNGSPFARENRGKTLLLFRPFVAGQWEKAVCGMVDICNNSLIHVAAFITGKCGEGNTRAQALSLPTFFIAWIKKVGRRRQPNRSNLNS